MSIFSKKDKLEKPSSELLAIHYRCLDAIRSQKLRNEHQQEIDYYINLVKPETDPGEILPNTEMLILACAITVFILLHYSFDLKNVKTISEDMVVVYDYGKMLKETCDMYYLSCTSDFLRMLIYIRAQVKHGFSKVFEEYLEFILPRIKNNDDHAAGSEIYFFKDLTETFGKSLENRAQLHDFIFSNNRSITA